MKNKSIPYNVLNDKGYTNTVIGTFEGKCGDANVTNENGMDIPRPVWEYLFNSDPYKRALGLGHYIGYLGHPEDPGYQHFEEGCIIMRDGWIDEDGQVYGKFDLIDTPVGRIVKAFIDAGVQFGISIRGAGDIVGNEVEAETFVFRGFDLVAFPAYTDAIPTFTEIAASTKVEDQVKYKKICATVENNLESITSESALNIIQSQFAKQSKEYSKIEERKQSLIASSNVVASVEAQKAEGMLELYLDAVRANKELSSQLKSIRCQLADANNRAITAARKVKSMKRILGSQLDELSSENSRLDKKYRTAITANSQLKKEISSLEESNLIYKQKVNTSEKRVNDKDSIIASLRDELRETVTATTATKQKISNRDNKMKELESDIQQALKLVEGYQNAYADLYASVIGVGLNNITVEATTSVQELKQLISGGTSTSSMSVKPDISEVVDLDYDDDGEIITL